MPELSLQSLNPSNYGDYVDLYLIPWAVKIFFAVLILIIGYRLVKLAVRVSVTVMTRGNLDPILVRFGSSILRWVLMIAVGIAALDQLGVNTTSLLAVLGAAGLAVGLALKDSLSNFAAGVMIIVFRPFRIGDYIEAAGTAGVVEHVRIFSTLLRTADNREVTVPNAPIYGGTIVNVSARDTRRIDLVFGIGYDDDLRKAKALLADILAHDERILAEPASTIGVLELADSSVNLFVRPWVKSSDFWTVRCELIERVKDAFDDNGISIPYPQRDVHVHSLKAAAI